MDLRRLRAGEWIAGAAGAALLLSLFLPWYGPGDATAWESFAVLDVLLAALAAAALAVVVVTASQPTPSMSVAYEALLVPAGAVVVAILLIRALDLPNGAATRQAGLWIGLAAGVAIVAAAVLAMRDERVSRPGRLTDATGVPIDAPPEIETLPAPPSGATRP